MSSLNITNSSTIGNTSKNATTNNSDIFSNNVYLNTTPSSPVKRNWFG
jgi:hypothetical protein